MAKIGIVTLIHSVNYGGILQSFALLEELRARNHEVDLIDTAMSSRRRLVRFCGGTALERWLFGLGARRRLCGHFSAFEYAHLRFSPMADSFAALRRLSADYDVLIAGSDQIWNQSWYLPAFFLDFAAPGVRRVAYAACCGAKLPIPETRRRKLLRDLQAFDRISVRNRASADFVRDLTGIEPPITADPTILHRWSRISHAKGLPDRYILLYPMSEKVFREKREAILGLAAALRLPLVTIHSQVLSPWLGDFGDVQLIDPEIEQWIAAFQNAEYVFTDSFHGTVFSLLNHKPLWNYIGKNHSFERIAYLVEHYGIDSACCAPSAVLENLERQRAKDYYSVVDDAIKEHRRRSLLFLEEAIGGTANRP